MDIISFLCMDTTFMAIITYLIFQQKLMTATALNIALTVVGSSFVAGPVAAMVCEQLE